MQGKRTRALDSRGRPVPGLYVRDGRYIAGFKLDKGTYRRIGSLIAQTKLKRFAALEGGYAEDLPLLVENFLDGFF